MELRSCIVIKGLTYYKTVQHVVPSLASSLEHVINILNVTPKDPCPYQEVIRNVGPISEETAEQLSFKQLCKLATHIRAMETHSGTNRIGTVMASKIKKDAVKGNFVMILFTYKLQLYTYAR